MPVAHITVTAVSDEGDTVIVWGRPNDARTDSEPVGYAFQAMADHDTVELAAQASRLSAGAESVIEYTVVGEGWCLGQGLTVS